MKEAKLLLGVTLRKTMKLMQLNGCVRCEVKLPVSFPLLIVLLFGRREWSIDALANPPVFGTAAVCPSSLPVWIFSDVPYLDWSTKVKGCSDAIRTVTQAEDISGSGMRN